MLRMTATTYVGWAKGIRPKGISHTTRQRGIVRPQRSISNLLFQIRRADQTTARVAAANFGHHEANFEQLSRTLADVVLGPSWQT